jgi:hypothetical protein
VSAPTPADSSPVYSLRLVLTRVSPLVWRRVLVSGDTSLSDLHRIFQILLGWSGEHLYSFRLHGQEYGTASGGSVWGEAEHVRLSRFRLHPLERFTYHYNFFSGWTFDVRLERVLESDPKRTHPICTGGPSDSAAILEFQPERFDRRAANAGLRAFAERQGASYEV